MKARTTAAPAAGTSLMAEPSATATVLGRLLLALLVTAVVTGVAALLVFTEAHRTVEAAGDAAAPAVSQVDAAYQALVDADRSAVRSAQARTMGAIGPGAQYEADITAASQSLAQVGEDNVASSAGSQQLALIEGLVVGYTGLIEQSDAAYRAGEGGSDGDGLASLLYASQIMHEQDSGGILDDLSQLRDMESQVLAEDTSAGWVNPFMSLAWILPALAQLVLLAWTGVFVHRRFRRVVTIPLVGAGAALIVLSVVSGLALVSDGQFASAQDGPFSAMAALSSSQANVTDADGQAALAVLIAQHCPQSRGACVRTVEELIKGCAGTVENDDRVSTVPPFTTASGKLASQDYAAAVAALKSADAYKMLPPALTGTSLFPKMGDAWTSTQNTYESQISRATAAFSIRLPIIAAMAVLMVALIPLALQPRINEYRYRSA